MARARCQAVSPARCSRRGVVSRATWLRGIREVAWIFAAAVQQNDDNQAVCLTAQLVYDLCVDVDRVLKVNAPELGGMLFLSAMP